MPAFPLAMKEVHSPQEKGCLPQVSHPGSVLCVQSEENQISQFHLSSSGQLPLILGRQLLASTAESLGDLCDRLWRQQVGAGGGGIPPRMRQIRLQKEFHYWPQSLRLRGACIQRLNPQEEMSSEVILRVCSCAFSRVLSQKPGHR